MARRGCRRKFCQSVADNDGCLVPQPKDSRLGAVDRSSQRTPLQPGEPALALVALGHGRWERCHASNEAGKAHASDDEQAGAQNISDEDNDGNRQSARQPELL
eukprot:CAMPEP_0119425900 /NCGR_PEP_ID=MMETSP1335-20130426/35302_1 /TAXON_ID=259385 /ORGANISM="Chrysoculter rhomboideus, Strain RCC1486" /LENGTH=102 /DNA_ID=CAMNT_0007451479 /DNA_START=72 /DNA_END=377 /DNA_ORIENTATION=+